MAIKVLHPRHLSLRKIVVSRLLHTKPKSVDAIVVGGGPSGLATVGNVLEQQPDARLLWVDPVFGAGRIGAHYREVPSNTKAKLFLDFAKAVKPFRHAIDTAGSKANPITDLESLPQNQGCSLHHAADMCSFLTGRLAEENSENIERYFGMLTAATFDAQKSLWVADLNREQRVTTPRLILATGSHPISSPLPTVADLSIQTLDLDTALKPSQLAQTLSPSIQLTIAVIGASHSAILVLMNLYNMATSTHPQLRIKWLTRHKKLRYAKEMDGWILYDNTGLKGQAASWAFENLEDTNFDASPVSKYVQRCVTEQGNEQEKYYAELPNCTHVVQAIGYRRNSLPTLTDSMDKTASSSGALEIEHDPQSGRFFRISDHTKDETKTAKKGSYVPGLFGAGIAFPERVTDPAGNTEYAVGLWKFMKFLKRVTPTWVGTT